MDQKLHTFWHYALGSLIQTFAPRYFLKRVFPPPYYFASVAVSKLGPLSQWSSERAVSECLWQRNPLQEPQQQLFDQYVLRERLWP